MAARFDRFTWTVVGVVVLLIVAAILTVTLGGGQGWSGDAYLNEDTPSAVVHDAYLALVRNDLARARSHFSSRVLAETEKNVPFAERFSYISNQNTRLRILKVTMEGEDKALVTVAIDRYAPGGLFNDSTIWTDRRTIPLVREPDGWKIDTVDLLF